MSIYRTVSPWRAYIALFAVFSAFLAASASAQSPNTGSLTVTVVDPNGGFVSGADISVTNAATGASRNLSSGADGSATFPALLLTGQYKVAVNMAGFAPSSVGNLQLRAGENANVTVRLEISAAESEVTVLGTAGGVRADTKIGLAIDERRIDDTPVLGRKLTAVPLLNSAFRQAKGTGDLFVNQIYFVTGVGGRRQATFALDGATNDEAWGRQTLIANIPLAAVQEVTVLSNSFSAEFGWTSGAAVNIVTKSGTNDLHGLALYNARIGDWQARNFSTRNFCPESVPTCTTPSTLQVIKPVNIPDRLRQGSAAVGGALARNRTFFFVSGDYTAQDRTAYLSSALPSFLLPSDGNLEWVGHYRQGLVNARIDHRINDNQTLMLRANLDRFYDDNPQDAVGGTSAPSVARKYSRGSWTGQINHSWVIAPNWVNEARFAYLNGNPVTRWEAKTRSTIYTRAGSVPFTIGQSRESALYGKQAQISDALSWTAGEHFVRFGGSVARHVSGGTGNEPGALTLGTFTFAPTGVRSTLPFDQLLLSDVLNYSQPISFGVNAYKLTQWLVSGFVQDDWKLTRDITLSLGLRYDRQTLTDATTNFAPRLGVAWAPGGDGRTSVRGSYAMYYQQLRSNLVGGYLTGGLDGLTSYTATPGQLGFPTCLTGSCLPVAIDPRTLPASQIPARDITIRAGDADFYRTQFARYGLNFGLLPNYPEKLVNPRSHVVTFGVEREYRKGLFIAVDAVRQHVSDLERTFDLNAPSEFERSAPGQCRAANCNNAASVAAANLTRPILPVAGGVRQVNVLANLGLADYKALQTQVTYRGSTKWFGSFSYTLSKATNTTEPDGNGIAPNQSIVTRLGEAERGPSVLDQRHRVVIQGSYLFWYDITLGGMLQAASARPFNATTGIDNNGDGLTNDRPVINGAVVGKSAFRGSATSEVSAFAEKKFRFGESLALALRGEVFNLFNHGNYLGRAQTIYGDAATPLATFGQLVAPGTSPNAIPAFANVDPPRMFQLQARFVF